MEGLKSTRALLPTNLMEVVAPTSVVVQRAARHPHFSIGFNLFLPGLASSDASLLLWYSPRPLGGARHSAFKSLRLRTAR